MDTTSAGDRINLMAFSKCVRIGIDKSSGLHNQFVKALPSNSDCVVVEEIDDANNWYENTAMLRRPPILAAIAKNETAGGLVVHQALNQVMNLPILTVTLIKAMTSKPVNLKVNYGQVPREGYVGEKFDLKVISILPFLLVFPMMIYRAIGFYVVERSVKFGHQQFLTGLSKVLYWLSSFVSDCWTFAIYYIGMIVFCLIFGLLRDRLLELTPLFIVVMLVSLIKIYIVQRIFTNKIIAENFAALVLLLEYLSFCVLFVIIRNWKKLENMATFEIALDYPVLLDPQVTVLGYMIDFFADASTVYFILLGQLLVFFLIFCFLECGPLIRTIARCFTPSLPNNKDLVSPSSSSNASPTNSTSGKGNLVLEVDGLVKRYGRKNIAVRGITFGVLEHECFGLLGVNGAGKTSTFEVLTGNATASAGKATVAGVDCSAPARIGYCPQFDALMEEMSGRQNLLILAALHGYSNPSAVTDTVIECVGMSAHANKQSKSYSGGQRRKISVAGALLAQNSLIILDEPTAGIDPVTRRDIWSVVCTLRDSTKTAIVLTSHSMDEVEALCSRVAIMKSGLIAAHGSSQTLKSRYGSYFKLSLVVPSESSEKVNSAVKEVFSKAKQLNGGSSSYNFEIPCEPGMLWSELFSSAIKVAKTLGAKDYCLSQASLEDAFIAIASGNYTSA